MSSTPSPAAKRRYDGKRIALCFGAFLIFGTILASTMAYYGHLMGNETRARFEADR